MKLTRSSSLPEVAIVVGEQLARHGIRAVLTGGACVAIYTGTYTSKDADFVLQGHVTQRGLDDTMQELGFERRGDRYVHREVGALDAVEARGVTGGGARFSRSIIHLGRAIRVRRAASRTLESLALTLRETGC